MTTVEVKGLRELREALLKTVPAETQGKVLQAALAKAAAPVTKAARSLAPVKTGRLRRAIYSYRQKFGETLTHATRAVGVRTGGKRGAFYWRFVEFGRAAVAIKSRKKREAKVLGTPAKGFFGKEVEAYRGQAFMRPAFEANKSTSVEVFKRELWAQIQKAAARARLKSPKTT